MQNELGELRAVDYGSGFLFKDRFQNIKDKYYTFQFRPDYYKKLLLSWILHHRFGRTNLNKSFLARNNSKILNSFINWYLVQFHFDNNDMLASSIYEELNFDGDFYDTLIRLLYDQTQRRS
jgi:hypothetical protein